MKSIKLLLSILIMVLISVSSLAAGSIRDIMSEGETKTYTLDNKEFEISVYSIGGDKVDISVNGEESILCEGECLDLDKGTICIDDVLTGGEYDMAEFELIASNNLRHNIEIDDIILSPENKVEAGKSLLGIVRVINNGEKDEEGIKVKISIPELGVASSVYIDEIKSEESTASEELYMKIPEGAESGEYGVGIEVEYDYGYVYEEREIEVVDGKIDLSDYPEIFARYGNLNGLIVVGDTAPAIDVLSAVDVMTSLQYYLDYEIDVGSSVLASEIYGEEYEHNIIAIGQAKNNPVVEKILSENDGDYSFDKNEGMIKIFDRNGYYQLIITGGSDDVVRSAAQVLANFEDYEFSGDEIRITIAILHTSDMPTQEYVDDVKGEIQNAVEDIDYVYRIDEADICIKMPFSESYPIYYEVDINRGDVNVQESGEYCNDLRGDFLIQFESMDKFQEFMEDASFDNFVNGEEYGYFNFGFSNFVTEDGIQFTKNFKERYCGIISANTNIMQRMVMGLSDCGKYSEKQGYSTKFNGATTNIKKLDDPSNVDELIFHKVGIGGVMFFNEDIDLMGLDAEYEDYIEIGKGKISIDTEKIPQLAGKKGYIFMEGLSFVDTPKILMDGEECGDTCKYAAYDPKSGVINFVVEHFTTFELVADLPESYSEPFQRANNPRSGASVERIYIQDEVVEKGEEFRTGVNVRNSGDFDLEGVKITIMIPELGLRRQIGSIDLDKEDEITKWIMTEIPEDAVPGEYDVRITISNDDIRRIKHRVIMVE